MVQVGTIQSKKTKNELFFDAVDYIYRQKLVTNQQELAEKIGISPSAFSRIKSGLNNVSDDTIRKMNEAFGNIFNMAYFRGKSGFLLANDAVSVGARCDSQLEEHTESIRTNSVIDASSATNAAIAAYVELTNRLKEEMAERLEDKDAIIREKDARIIALERTIADRDARIIVLERQIAAYHADDLSNYPFSVGVADKLVPQNNKKI